jgi:hypothetical protein
MPKLTPDGWSEPMRLEPGSVVALHRHTGEVHAFNIRGTREILGCPSGPAQEQHRKGDKP